MGAAVLLYGGLKALEHEQEAEVDGEHGQADVHLLDLGVQAEQIGNAGLEGETVGDEEGVTGIQLDAQGVGLDGVVGLAGDVVLDGGGAEDEFGAGIDIGNHVVASSDIDVERRGAGFVIFAGLEAESRHHGEVVHDSVATGSLKTEAGEALLCAFMGDGDPVETHVGQRGAQQDLAFGNSLCGCDRY